MDKSNLKLIFMGTPEISAFVFEEMILNGFQFVGLIAQPDKPTGRHNEIEFVPTKKIALKYNIPVFQPLKIRKDFEFVKELKPDLIITLAYGQIVPQALLDIPTFGCLNLHGSILPKYRGAAPIQYSLINNDKTTGFTLMKMTYEMDAGDIYSTKEIEIENSDNCSNLFEKMKYVARDLILETCLDYVNGKLVAKKQDEKLVTFSPSIKKEEEKLNLSLPIKNVYGWIRALSDKPGAYLFLDQIKLKIYKASILNSVQSKNNIGEIINADKNGFVIQCLDGQLSILELQKEGKKRMDYKSFLNGSGNLKGIFLK